MTYRRKALFALVAVLALAQILLRREISKTKRRQLRRQRLYRLIRTTSRVFGGTREDSIPSWARIVLP